mgnify:CR=1 FL=1
MKTIPMANPFIGEEEANAVFEAVNSGWLSMGPKVAEFEKDFAEMVGSKYAIATNNGTAALHVAMIAAGIKDGDEVLVPDITFASTANVVLYERAVPVLVECDSKTFNINLEDLEKKITEKTKAIIPVDMNGMPVDYNEILEIAKHHNLQVIADSAESLGAIYKGKKVGSIAPMHIFSFFPNKNMTTGEGGMVTTNNSQVAKAISQLRNMGQDYRYHHILLGFNYRMTEVAAAIGLEQMKKLNSIMLEKERIVERYNVGFKDCLGVITPWLPDYVDKHAWYMYTITLNSSINRDEVVNKLKELGVETRTSFPPIHAQPFYIDRFGDQREGFPISTKAWGSLINLPIWVGLPKADQDYIIASVKRIIDSLCEG